MTRVFLAAGVAALAISAPASARPGGGHGGGDRAAMTNQSGGQRAQRVQSAPRMERAQRVQSAPRMERMQGFAAPRMERAQRFAAPRMERAQRFAAPRMERQTRVARVDRQAARANIVDRRAQRTAMRPARTERVQTRVAERQQIGANRMQAQNRMADRQQLRANRVEHVQNRMAQSQQVQANRVAGRQDLMAQRQQLRFDRGARTQDLMAQRQDNRVANVDAFRTSRLAALNSGTRILAPAQAVSYVGAPISTVRNVVTLAALPSSVQYLYPDTPNYYYQYGDGYLYQVDRGSNLIAALLPLLGGGYMPGQYLPNYYMSSYVPDYYGLNSFYPASYGAGYGYGYGSGYDNLCNRYANGVVYQVDCVTGMVEDVIPLYAGGYGVGQMLPSSYGYYNVPYQYRDMYYDSADAGYWYAPGAIYQYDRSSSLITSVAALLSPGFSVGQPLPMGYNVYNVPYAYRSTYYDTPTAWYRYNNGYIYQVDPTTQLVTAIVASALT